MKGEILIVTHPKIKFLRTEVRPGFENHRSEKLKTPMGWISCSNTGKHSAPEEEPTNTLSNIQMEIKIASGKKKIGFYSHGRGRTESSAASVAAFCKDKKEQQSKVPLHHSYS